MRDVLPFGVGGGLVAIKTLLSRDPCVHANTAIEMIDAILSAHAQPAPVQEPVACQVCGGSGFIKCDALQSREKNNGKWGRCLNCQPYTTPPAAQRQWVGLSQDELDAMFSNTIKGKKLVNYVARAIEAKLRKKNAAAQPAVQEPVGEVCGYYERGFDAEKTRYGKLYNQDLPLGIKLYTTQPAAQPAPVQQVAATITISRRGAVNTIDNHFEDCVRDWPDGEYKLVLATPPAAQQDHEPENEPYVSLASVQDPVAWRIKVETKLRDGSVDVGYQLRNEKLSVYDEPLYITPPAQPAPVQEPVDGTQVSKVWWDGEKLMAKPIPLEDIYQPVDWKAEYLKSVESGCITLDELREARAELDATNRQVEILSDALAESRREVAALKAVQEPVAHQIIAGALFDFMGFLTSRNERLMLSSADNASPVVEAITNFAKMRGLSLDDARVEDWQDTTPPAAQRQWVGLTDEEVNKIVEAHTTDDHGYDIWCDGRSAARSIEAKLKEKNT